MRTISITASTIIETPPPSSSLDQQSRESFSKERLPTIHHPAPTVSVISPELQTPKSGPTSSSPQLSSASLKRLRDFSGPGGQSEEHSPSKAKINAPPEDQSADFRAEANAILAEMCAISPQFNEGWERVRSVTGPASIEKFLSRFPEEAPLVDVLEMIVNHKFEENDGDTTTARDIQTLARMSLMLKASEGSVPIHSQEYDGVYSWTTVIDEDIRCLMTAEMINNLFLLPPATLISAMRDCLAILYYVRDDQLPKKLPKSHRFDEEELEELGKELKRSAEEAGQLL